MFGLGIWELIAILLIVLVVFGAKRLPEIGRSLGEGLREFKDSVSSVGESPDRELPPGEADAGERDGEAREAEGPGPDEDPTTPGPPG